MIWDKTKQVGCATAPPSVHAYSILVCRYDPPGNFPNQLPYPTAAPPSQGVGELENTYTESGGLPLEQSAAPPGESGGGDNSGSGGGDNSGSS